MATQENISVKPNKVGVTNALVSTLISFCMANSYIINRLLYIMVDPYRNSNYYSILRNEILV